MFRVPLLLALTSCASPTPGDKPDVPGPTDDTHGAADTHADSATDTHADSAPDSAGSRRPNIVVVLADDQSFGTMWAMPVLNARLLPEAIDFRRAYVTVPMCCPMRASLLSGGWYPKDTGVLTNSAPIGGVARFADTDTLGTRLQGAGYATAIMGKYLNDYENGMSPNVAPGWDRWVVSDTGDGAYEQTMVLGASGPDASTVGTFGNTGGEHLTSYLFDQALAFVDDNADRPFFLLVTPNSPHLSGAPATEDLALYEGLSLRPPAWNEEDLSDKPAWLQSHPVIGETAAGLLDTNARTMLRNLASLDREVGGFLDALAARGVLDDTVFVYTSDNGYLNGEHRLALKGLPYEESVRVPFIVRAPGVPARVDTRLVAVNVDLAATVFALAGLPPTGEGMPLAEAFADPARPLRDHVYVDNYTDGAPVWAGVVTEQFKYVEWGSGESELYDLSADPFELVSVHATPPPGADVAAWRTLVSEHRGLAVLTESVPDGTVGEPYRAELARWGGTDPVLFALDGDLPPGLTLGGAGVIQGVPTEAGEWVFGVWARDSSVSPWNGRAQSFNRALRIVVGAPPPLALVERSAPTEARIVLHARPGVSVQVRATPEPVPEGMRRVSDTVVAGPDGRVVLTIPGLRVDRPWYWVAYYDGVPAGHGEIPPAVR